MQKIISKNKRIQKFISCLIIITLLAPAVFVSIKPKKTEAIFGFGDIVFDPAHTAVTVKILAQEIYKQAMMALARKLLDKITQNTVNWINSGFHGNPLYLENPNSFFKDIAKYEVRTLVDVFGHDSLRFPFGKDFSLNTIDAYKRQLADNAQYSLSKVITDPVFLNNYRNDFNVGGWNGFLINTQYPQNNYLGFQMLATEDLARRLQDTNLNNAQKVNQTLQQGLGFLSPQTCPSNPNYKNDKNQFLQPGFQPTTQPNIPDPTGTYDADGNFVEDQSSIQARYDAGIAYEENVANEQQNWNKTYVCPGGLVNTTPGSVVGSQISTALNSKIHQTELAAAIGNSLAAVFDALINKFISSGLNALSNKINPPPDPATDPNDFIYMGNSINSLNTNYSLNSVNSVPINTGSNSTGGICATQTEIDAFLASNPGDEDRLPSVFPCN